jgi:hypothetical protein
MALRIASVGWVTVSLRKSINAGRSFRTPEMGSSQRLYGAAVSGQPGLTIVRYYGIISGR